MIDLFPRLGEQLFRRTLSNGLAVAVVPRAGFQRKLAYFVTDFGSIHSDFRLEGETYHTPSGVAHFLEHKMFELPGRDVTAEFASLGASVNAFTSYDMTAYYFSCTENFEESLKLLLEFVSTPYFEAESVLREQGIIDQEIGMNADAPDSQVFEQLMEQMYRKHPIRIPILGTSETIRQITPEVLHTCHRAFYTPGNMILCVVGDVDPEQVCAATEEILGKEPRPVGVKLRDWQEEMKAGGGIRRKMEVAMPTFQLGFLCEPTGSGEAAIRQEVVGDLAAEALFGESSTLYLKLYEQGLIDPSFGGGLDSLQDYVTLNAIGDSDDPFAVRDAILEQGARIAAEGIGEEDFLRMKRSAMGSRIRALDNFDSVCFRLCAYHFTGTDYFAFPEIYEKVRSEDVQAFIARVVTPERCTLSLIEPKEEDGL